MPNPLLLDLGPLSCNCTDFALESIYKSLSEPMDDGIWTPHHDPFLRDAIEDVTARGQAILLSIQNDLLGRFKGKPTAALQKGLLSKALRWMRWTDQEFQTVQQQLESKPTDQYGIDDWMMLVDWIIQRYLPDSVINTEAEYLAVRSVLLGKVKANMDGMKASEASIQTVVAAVPHTLSVAGKMIEITAAQDYLIGFARVRAAEFLTDIGEAARHRMKQVIVDHEEKRVLGDPQATSWSLQSQLLDEFGILNRDWRRVALTETARNAGEGFIMSMPEGASVRRFEAYAGACSFCKSINGKIFTVVSPQKPDKDDATEVWSGKSNIGRSSSPRKRVGDELVERLPSEIWTVVPGPIHPHCRGGFVRVVDVPANVDPKFVEWMDKILDDDYAAL